MYVPVNESARYPVNVVNCLLVDSECRPWCRAFPNSDARLGTQRRPGCPLGIWGWGVATPWDIRFLWNIKGQFWASFMLWEWWCWYVAGSVSPSQAGRTAENKATLSVWGVPLWEWGPVSFLSFCCDTVYITLCVRYIVPIYVYNPLSYACSPLCMYITNCFMYIAPYVQPPVSLCLVKTLPLSLMSVCHTALLGEWYFMPLYTCTWMVWQ